MITMEFEEMKKIWDTQNNEPLYAINQQALHNRILSKKKQGDHITNTSELLLIIVNMFSACVILSMNLFKNNWNIFMVVLAAWMFYIAVYLLVSRIRRKMKNNRFDRSLQGDLRHALSEATYQVRLSYIGRWSILPIALLSLLGLWDSGKSVWIILGILIFFILVTFASGWEQNIYKARKRELEILQNKLAQKEFNEHSS
jgi:uncharacterized protein involved in response to NO